MKTPLPTKEESSLDARSSSEYLQTMLAEANQFEHIVKHSACELLSRVLDHDFFNEVRKELYAIDVHNWKKINSFYFVYRWLCEIGAFKRINDCLDRIYNDIVCKDRRTSLRSKAKGLTGSSFTQTVATAFEFELMSLFERDNILAGIDVPLTESRKENADFEVSIDNRKLFVEATAFDEAKQYDKCYYPSIERESEYACTSVGAGDIRTMCHVFRQKLITKVMDQLLNAADPVVIVVVPPVRCHQYILEDTVQSLFQREDAQLKNQMKILSAVVISRDYTIPGLKCYTNPSAVHQLTDVEVAYFNRHPINVDKI
jgi:hypothetical protein